MDELFLLPPAPVAMPRAYWLDDHVLSSQLVLVEPSVFEFNRVLTAFENRGTNDFDMEIVNNLYADSCLIIPHRRYDLLTGEFRATEHHRYLGSKEEEWDPMKIFKEAKFLHFSDWPHPKPWINAGATATAEHEPKCTVDPRTGNEDCQNQEIWLAIYDDFHKRRKCATKMWKRGCSRKSILWLGLHGNLYFDDDDFWSDRTFCTRAPFAREVVWMAVPLPSHFIVPQKNAVIENEIAIAVVEANNDLMIVLVQKRGTTAIWSMTCGNICPVMSRDSKHLLYCVCRSILKD
nr:glucose n-acetyltransferase 1 [Quercus suber]